MEFAKGTGDYLSLSVVDLEVMALGLQLLVEKGHEEKIRKVSQRPVNHFSESNKGIVDRSQITEVVTGEKKDQKNAEGESTDQIPEGEEQTYETDENDDGSEEEHEEGDG